MSEPSECSLFCRNLMTYPSSGMTDQMIYLSNYVLFQLFLFHKTKYKMKLVSLILVIFLVLDCCWARKLEGKRTIIKRKNVKRLFREPVANRVVVLAVRNLQHVNATISSQ